ncbi:hypothetical protein HPP92_019114 [Vanilla planifolia]|uniref:Uncharacterized protein n=1 Tax=Vanilla planifolia TaxID=51239 RepID=A0A835Q3P7_VANPL|nr:hypothetical protein HPP92_019645 [Vanilla planifolia]KAG0464950.1 hypothetical protein HPP92_019114 [Vanilla planifolia]
MKRAGPGRKAALVFSEAEEVAAAPPSDRRRRSSSRRRGSARSFESNLSAIPE